MELTRTHVIVILLVTILVVTSLGVAEFLNRANDQAGYKAQAEKIYSDTVSQVERIRNVTLPRVPLVVVNKAWAMKTWGTDAAAPDLQNINRTERIYKGLFLMPENSSLYQATVNWAGDFVAVTWESKIYVIQENFDPWNMPDAEATFVHELTHIMQGQMAFQPPDPPTFDGDRAHTALIEGDATYMQNLFVNQSTASPSAAPQASAGSAFGPAGWVLLGEPLVPGLCGEIPKSVSNFDYFPYSYGPDFIGAAYSKGGWAAVNALYRNQPNTTAQVLDQQKYFAGQDAQEVTAPTLTESGWKQIRNDRYGQYFIQVMLADWLPSDQAQKTASAWAGDNFSYYERGADYLFTWNISWSSPQNASQFRSAFQNMANAAGATNETANSWQSSGRYLKIEWNPGSNSTLIVCSNNETAFQQTFSDQD